MQVRKNQVTLPLFLLLSSQLINRTALSAITPVLPIYMRDLGFAIADLGIAAASLGFALIIFEPLWGSLINKLGAKKIFLSSTLLTALVLFSYTLIRDLAGFTFLRFLTGVLGSAGAVSTRTLVWQAVPRKERAFGTWYAISAAAGVIGPVIGGIVATQSYVLTFYASAIIAAVAFFLSLGTPESKNTDSTIMDSTIKGMDKTEKKILLATSTLIILPYFLRTVYTTYIPVFATESPKFLLSPMEIGIAVAAMGAVGLFAPFIYSELASKKGVKKIIILGMILETSSFTLLPVITGFPMLCLTAVLLGLGEAAISPCMMTFLMSKIRSSNLGLAIGVYGAGEDIGILTGPLVVGYLYQDYGAEFSFCLTAALMLANTMISVPLLKKAAQ
jgi:MFS family permease